MQIFIDLFAVSSLSAYVYVTPDPAVDLVMV